MKLLTRREAVQYLRDELGVKRSYGHLCKLATVGGGPKYRRLGRNVLYNPIDLRDWVKKSISDPVSSTSEY